MKRMFLILALSILFIPTGISQDLPSYVPTDGLVAYYPFNGNANDASGNGNNGTVSGAILTADKDGDAEKAYEFTVNENGGWGNPQQEITVDYNTSMNSNTITLSAWVFPRTKPGSYADRPLTIFGRWADGVSNEVFRFQITYDQNTTESAGAGANKVFLQISNASSNGNTSNNSEFFKGGDIPFNQWTHVAVTYDGSVGKVYQNGQLVAENQIDVNINAGGSALNIGSLKSSNGTWYLFDGKLDELGYWNKVLSAEKIGNLFSNSADILLNGTVSVENNQIKNVADPSDGKDAVNKDYLLEKIALLQDQIDALQSTTGSGTVTDQDGNSYPYLTYGDQVWTVKNAEMITYRDGTPIPQVTDATEWANLTTGAWCYHDNDPSNGKLYNWYAIAGIHDNDENTPNKVLAPEGWHVPSDTEWTELENYLIANGYNYDGTTTENKIGKSLASTSEWNSSTNNGDVGSNQILNNSSGFNAPPKSYRIENGEFYSQGVHAMFWSSTESLNFNFPMAWNRYLSYDSENLFRNASLSTDKNSGLSVRIVSD